MSYLTATSGVSVSLLAGVGYSGDALGDVLISVENLGGSNFGDVLIGDSGSNILSGYNGNDRLDGGLGNDTLNGGHGIDVADYTWATSQLVVDLRTGVATLNGETDLLQNIENVESGSGHDRLIGDVLDNVLVSGSGSDTVSGFDGDDTIFGGEGADILGGNNGDDVIYGGGGRDHMFGGNGNDVIFGDSGNDILEGREGDDALNGGSGADVLYGGNGFDTLDGGSGDDTLYGWNGNDMISGGQGNDELTGGAGSDAFVFLDNHGDDVITDFNVLESGEVIDLSRVSTVLDFTDLSTHMTQVGLNVEIDTGSGTITLVAVTLSDLNGDDFVF